MLTSSQSAKFTRGWHQIDRNLGVPITRVAVIKYGADFERGPAGLPSLKVFEDGIHEFSHFVLYKAPNIRKKGCLIPPGLDFLLADS